MEPSQLSLSDAFFSQAAKRLAGRLSVNRYEHSKRVSETAVEIARAYKLDESKARIAGLLHDWDKEYDADGIRNRVHELGISVEKEVYETMPRLLHGITAATALKTEFPSLDDEVLQAIARHSTGSINMTDLDMVIYVADVIEPERSYHTMGDLRASVAKVSLEALFFMTYKQIVSHLLIKERRVYPDALRIWNYYVSRQGKPTRKKGSE